MRGGSQGGNGGGRRPLPPGVGRRPATDRSGQAPTIVQHTPSQHLKGNLPYPPPPLGRGGAGHPGLRAPQGPQKASGALGAQAGVLPVRVWQEFVSKLPPAGFISWRRTLTRPGSDISGLTVGTSTEFIIETVPTKITRLIFACEFVWLDQELDPLDADALTAFQDHQNTYGRWPALLLANNQAMFDVKENVFDPNGGAGLQREVRGVTRLNQNILDMGGGHPNVLYVKENQELRVRWTNIAAPGHIPSAVGVELRGYSLPKSVFEDVMEKVRRG